MAVGKYEKDGKAFWYVYVNLRSPIKPGVRVQRRINELESEKAAYAEEKKLLACLCASSEAHQRKGAHAAAFGQFVSAGDLPPPALQYL